MGLASINIKFSADLRQFSSEMQSSMRQIKKLGSDLQNIGTGLTLGLTAPILAFGVGSVLAFNDSAKAIAQVDAALKSTGGTVGFTSEQLQKMAADLQAVTLFDDDEILKKATANLLTFNNIQGETFAAAQQAAIDLSTRLDGDLQAAALQVGKALQDPVKGITALSKAGVSFSSEQKATIKSMVATNDVAGAQALILKELQKEFGGSAAAAAKAGTGSFVQLKNQVGDLSEEFGKIIVDALQPFVARLKNVVSFLQELSPEAKKTIAIIAGLAAVIGPLLVGVGAFLTLVPSMIAGFTAIKVAVASLTATIAANPIGALAVAIGLVVSSFFFFNSESKKTIEQQSVLNDLNKEATSLVAGQIVKVDNLVASARNENKSKAERLSAIKDLNKISPEYLGNLNLENINTDNARLALEKYNVALLNAAKAKVASSRIQSIRDQQAQADIDAVLNADKIKKAEQELAKVRGSQTNIISKLAEKKRTSQNEEIAQLQKIYDENEKYLELLKTVITGQETASKGSSEVKLKEGTISYYESLISIAQKEQKEVAKTSLEYDNLQSKIDAYQKKIDAISNAPINLPKPTLPTLEDEGFITPTFSLEDLKNQLSYYEQLREKFAKTSEQYKALSEQINNTKTKINAIEGVEEFSTSIDETKTKLADFTTSVNQAFTTALEGFAEGFAGIIASFAQGGASLANIGALVFNTMGNLAIQVGKIAIATGIAVLGIKKALQSLNPYVAIAAGIALVALGTVVKSQLGDAGAFANGGIVGGSSFYGDKILARVNSGELILNNKQQKNLYNQLGNGGSGGADMIVGETKIVGSDMLILLKRAKIKEDRRG